MLASSLGMLLGFGGVFFALLMFTLAVMFSSGSMRFGSVLMMFSCFIVFVSRHWIAPAGLG